MTESIFTDVPPGFNHKVAREVYDAIMKCDSDAAAQMMSRAIVFDVMYRDVILHKDFLDEQKEKEIAKKAELYKEGLAREYVRRRLAGEPVEELVAATEALSKALPDWWDNSAAAKKRRRNARGQFAVETQKLRYSGGARPMHQAHFDALHGGHGHDPKTSKNKDLTARQLARYQEAVSQLHQITKPYLRSKQQGRLITVNSHGQEKHLLLQGLTAKQIADHVPADGPRIDSATIELSNPKFANPNVYHAFDAIGMGHTGAILGNQTPEQWRQSGLNPRRMEVYGNKMAKPIDEKYAYQPGAHLYNRLNHGGKLLEDTLGPYVGPKTRAAFRTAEWAGQYGPEAQRVIGPTVQRTSYRYRGTERTPDSRLREAIIDTRKSGVANTAEGFRNAVIHVKRGPRGDISASPVVSYFRNILPKTEHNELQRMAGTIPPSHGIIIDKTGHVVTQAVGYGDDWYLPFNLKKLSKLNGGDYIRTRTYGGPTTEDIYTGLMAGAESMTVVSHNGTYTVEFDPTFRKGRRYNDKAARMVARYGQLLDAVQSERVRGEMLDPSRLDELEKEAEDNVGLDDQQKYDTELTRLKTKEQLRPTMSQEQKESVKRQFIERLADRMNQGEGLSAEEFQQNAANLAISRYRQAKKIDRDRDTKLAAGTLRSANAEIDRALDNGETPDPQHIQQRDWAKGVIESASDTEADKEAERQIALDIADPDKLIDALNQRTEYEDFESKAERQLRANMTPLKLNGQGYNKALISLQEQFPYYIKDVKFHPWKDMPQRTDTGYIKPRHIRPEQALSGYFAESITGHGKVHADSVAHGKIRSFSDEKTRQRQSNGVSGATGATTTAAGATPDKKKDKFSQQEADRALAKHLASLLQGNGNFSSNAGSAVAGQPLSGANWLRDPNDQHGGDPDKKIAQIGKLTPSQIDDAIDAGPTQFHQTLAAAVNALETQKYLDIEGELERLIEGHRSGGAKAKEKDFDPSDPWSMMAAKKSSEFKLGGRFSAERKHILKDLIDSQNDKHIQELEKRFKGQPQELPDLDDYDLTDPDPAVAASHLDEIDRKLDEIHDYLRTDARNKDNFTSKEQNLIGRQIIGYWSMRQLTRRYRETLERDRQQASAGQQPGSVTQILLNANPNTPNLSNLLSGLTGGSQPAIGSQPQQITGPTQQLGGVGTGQGQPKKAKKKRGP